eukprot:TRINITY_DN65531_c0_g1_i1.p1 TRINITY_DN65531_c0_g1~~TRINITY_DN65531_c0_g1_i1.p1  ORF type:complete len:370 (-),score=35.45 TRINITY_DN65531_c0_g1_i1:38-1147(-)
MADARESKRARFDSSSVLLNVGGQRFRTSRETLRSFPASFFGSLISERHKVDFDDDGSVFIDRDPKHFGVILEHLRNGKQLSLASYSVEELDGIRLEAEYYGLAHLARSCRRFKLCDSHFMSQERSKSGHVTVLRGMRHAAAMFDVIDPDNFEVTFAGRVAHQNTGDDWTSLHGCINEPGVLIGLVPLDVDLSLDWEPCPNPLPNFSPGPFDAAAATWSCPWARGREFPLNPEQASKHWPCETYIPPAFMQGVAFTISVCLFKDGKSNNSTDFQADGFLTRCLVQGSAVAAEVDLNSWWDRNPGSVALRFTRSEKACILRVRLEDDDGKYIDEELNFASLGLDPKVPYRPAIFFGTGTHVDVHDVFGDT